MNHNFFAPSTIVDMTDDGTGFPQSILPKTRSPAASFEFSHRLCRLIGLVADGSGVVPAEGDEKTTFLLAKHETAWWWRMQSPACGTKARRHGHQTSADRINVVHIISVNERKVDAAARRWSDGADLLSKADKK